MNYLSKRDVSIVSEIAGTTRDVLETHLNFDGFPVIISDTAGIRASKDIIEKEGMRQISNKDELNKIGTFKVNINFHSDVKANITIKIAKIKSK